MFVSPRFRDIFASDPIRIRRDDRDRSAREEESRSESQSHDAGPDADAIWREITAAHRRAARAFTPEFNKASDMVQDET